MMLKEKSNQWARLKLLLLLPFGILSVYAFAGNQVNELTVNESVILFTAHESDYFFQESQENPIMNEMNEPVPQDPVLQKQTTNPLYIVDGKETDSIESLLPENIESISVLKDQSAVSTYGEKGKNGVILITTKHYQSVKVNPPLYIVDGKETDNIESLLPDNIESISILKEQSAVNTYGEKGKNGVVIITTKKQ